ncbi:unnamed protein product [Schistosoma turkestanicum]|nr:unnamed protein product [Schistosoma turkestanicum]
MCSTAVRQNALFEKKSKSGSTSLLFVADYNIISYRYFNRARSNILAQQDGNILWHCFHSAEIADKFQSCW